MFVSFHLSNKMFDLRKQISHCSDNTFFFTTDPYHEDKNYEYNVFLPVVNNNNASKFFNVTGTNEVNRFILIHCDSFLGISRQGAFPLDLSPFHAS